MADATRSLLMKSTMDAVRQSAARGAAPRPGGTLHGAAPRLQPVPPKAFEEAALYEEDTVVSPRTGWSKETTTAATPTLQVDIDLDIFGSSPLPAAAEAPTIAVTPPFDDTPTVAFTPTFQDAPTLARAQQPPAIAPERVVPAAPVPPAAEDVPAVPVQRPSEATMKLASTLLAQYIGPVSTLFVKRAAQTATHRDQFCQLLAYHIAVRRR